MKMIASHFNPRLGSSAISRVSDAVFFSTEAPSRRDSLKQRICDASECKKFSIVPLLDKWIEEGRLVNQSELNGIIKLLRKFGRHSHALQVQTWMTKSLNFKLDSKGYAIRVYTIWKLHGVEKAEHFFKSITRPSKEKRIYDSMLRCYAAGRLVSKAEKLFEDMKKLGFVDNAFPYNVMLVLYVRIENYEKVDALVEEMKEKSITANSFTYGSMLRCYAAGRLVSKAEKLFEDMKKLGFVDNAFPYNIMLVLYVRIENYEKVDALVEEMKEKSITANSFTSDIVLQTYAKSNNVEKMEILFTEMEEESQATVTMFSYSSVVKGYMRAGFSEKALSVLTKAEEMIKINGYRRDYEIVFGLYAALKKKDDLYRAWDTYKSAGPVDNYGYLSMLCSLRVFDDVVGSEKIGEEWESGNTGFNPIVARLVILAYCARGNHEKALALSEKITSEGKDLDSVAWMCLASKYCTYGDMSKAVELLKKALSSLNRNNFILNKRVLASCLDYLKSKGDKAKASELLLLVRGHGYLRIGICDRLLDFVFGDKDSGASALIFAIYLMFSLICYLVFF